MSPAAGWLRLIMIRRRACVGTPVPISVEDRYTCSCDASFDTAIRVDVGRDTFVVLVSVLTSVIDEQRASVDTSPVDSANDCRPPAMVPAASSDVG